MKRINDGIYPKNGGYLFIESDQSRHVGTSPGNLLLRVIAYRKRAGLPAGNPEVEIQEQICARNPGVCYESDRGSMPTAMKKTASMKSKVLLWCSILMRRKQNGDLRYVSLQETHDRVNICAACPKNTAYPDGCSSCKKAIREYRTNLVPGRPMDTVRLHGCLVLGEDTGIATHLDEHRVANPELPNHCWRKAGA